MVYNVRGQVCQWCHRRIFQNSIDRYFEIICLFKKFFIEKNPILLPQRWQEMGEPDWSNNAIINIFETENDFNEYICSQSNCESIWISIDATYSKLNKKGGEYKFHSILNSRPAYRNADNTYLAYNGYGGS